jgi:hypothetical protein
MGTTAAIVVIEVGPTKGVLWELDYAMHNVEKTHILLILPWDEDDYREFCNVTASIFPQSLPPQRPASRLLAFDKFGTPLPLAPSTELNFTLQPFFERLGLRLPEFIALPADVRPMVQQRVIQGQFLGVSDYVGYLIRDDHARNSMPVNSSRAPAPR